VPAAHLFPWDRGVMPMNAELMRVGAIVWKDLTAERRTKANFNAVASWPA
jgi:hypothetical protein